MLDEHAAALSVLVAEFQIGTTMAQCAEDADSPPSAPRKRRKRQSTPV
jgi:hypothetical protein